MNWAETIALLERAGYQQGQIAKACGCGQSTISDLATGKTTEPRYALGQALLGLERAAKRKLASQAKANAEAQ